MVGPFYDTVRYNTGNLRDVIMRILETIVYVIRGPYNTSRVLSDIYEYALQYTAASTHSISLSLSAGKSQD